MLYFKPLIANNLSKIYDRDFFLKIVNDKKLKNEKIYYFLKNVHYFPSKPNTEICPTV